MFYIMSYNTLVGFHNNCWNRLDHLFFTEAIRTPMGDHATFGPVISGAKGFETFEEAQNFGRDFWGRLFFDESMMIVYFQVDEHIRLRDNGSMGWWPFDG